MREILFRGKRISDGSWVEGGIIKTFHPNFDHESPEAFNFRKANCYCICANNRDIFVEQKSIGQFTGLTDKNGKKIFEGDIILFEDESPTNYEYHDCTEMRCGEIKFDCGEFYLTNRIAVEMSDLVYDNKLDGQIIGNIHDNPELLKGE